MSSFINNNFLNFSFNFQAQKVGDIDLAIHRSNLFNFSIYYGPFHIKEVLLIFNGEPLIMSDNILYESREKFFSAPYFQAPEQSRKPIFEKAYK